MRPHSSGSRTVTAERSSVAPSKHALANLEAAHFYPYDAIVKKWESYLSWKGVAKGYAKKFLSQTSLIAGSPEAEGDPIWGQNHVFYKGVDSKSGTVGLYFIDSDISSLLDLILAKQPALDRAMLMPNATRKVAYSSFESIIPVIFSTKAELQAFRAKQIPKGDAILLNLNKKSFEFFQEKGLGTIMAIDIESYERNHAYILEIGWSSIGLSKAGHSDEVIETRSCEHIIISDYIHLRNGDFSPNHRHRFNFGQSQELSLKKTITLLSDLISSYNSNGPLFLVFHSAGAEIAYFATLGIETSNWVTGLPDPSFWNDLNPPAPDESRLRDGVVYVMDTQKLFCASGLPQARKQIGLSQALEALDIPYRFMHNAGNDACYTLAVYECLVGSGSLRDELRAEEQARQAKIRPKGRQGEYSGWD